MSNWEIGTGPGETVVSRARLRPTITMDDCFPWRQYPAPEVTFGLSPVSRERGEKGDDLSTSRESFRIPSIHDDLFSRRRRHRSRGEGGPFPSLSFFFLLPDI